MHHIIQNYDRLPEIVVFTQARPFDHCPGFVEEVSRVKSMPVDVLGHGWINYGTVVREDGNGCPGHARHNLDGSFGIPIGETMKALFPQIECPPSHIYFPAGACFATTRNAIRQHPKSFYQKMMRMGYNKWKIPYGSWGEAVSWHDNPAGHPRHWEMGFVYERLWAFIFCARIGHGPPWVPWSIREGIMWNDALALAQ